MQSTKNSCRMQVFQLDIDITQFWVNFWELRNTSSITLPMDSFLVTCNKCSETLIVFPHGEYFSEAAFKSAEELVISEIRKVKDEHQAMCQSSTGSGWTVETPENIVLMVNNVSSAGFQSFEIEGEYYDPTALVTKGDTPAMMVFQRRAANHDDAFKKFMINNFGTILNCEPAPRVTLDDIEDPEEVAANQHILPRMIGGGRRMTQDYKYECQWCSAEALEKPTRGRFCELKNYRDHFRRYHMPAIPFTEFLNKVDRNEPKFYCKLCRQKLSLGNQLRHQVREKNI